MIITLFILLLVSHAVAAWIYFRRTQSTPTLGEAYRDETLNQYPDPL